MTFKIKVKLKERNGFKWVYLESTEGHIYEYDTFEKAAHILEVYYPLSDADNFKIVEEN